MFRRTLFRWLSTGLLCLAAGGMLPALAAEQVTVFAAASATNALQDLAALYEKEKGIKVVGSFAASSALAKQIENGAPADIFISADLKWMDYLESKGKIVDSTRGNLLGNLLVPRHGPHWRDAAQGCPRVAPAEVLETPPVDLVDRGGQVQVLPLAERSVDEGAADGGLAEGVHESVFRGSSREGEKVRVGCRARMRDYLASAKRTPTTS